MSPHDRVLITGAAGFIGFHLSLRLLEQGYTVFGLDNLSAYYDPNLKLARRAELVRFPNFHFEEIDLADRDRMLRLFDREPFQVVINLAAQAGVRNSLKEPHRYGEANLMGFLNVLEGCRKGACRHLIYASSSSVYGANTTLPSRSSDHVDHPINLYAATKRANELMAHAYAHLFAIPATGLRFFTVYGPWGRPDMAYWLFTQAIFAGRPIQLFNHGRVRRDFTYIDDVIEALVRLIDRPPARDADWSGDQPSPAKSAAPWRIYNVGNSQPVPVTELVDRIEKAVGKRAIRELVPMQPGDAIETCADSSDLEKVVGFRPTTPLAEGIDKFVTWFRHYHSL